MKCPAPPPAGVKYIADIQNAQEVSLLGTADLAYWRERLRAEALFPHVAAGQAEVLLSSVRLKWMGLRFRELSLSIMVSRRADGATLDGAFLVWAGNTNRFLAFCERTLFQTPYQTARVEIEPTAPARITLFDGAAIALRAEMDAGERLSKRSETPWEGAIFIPGGPPPGRQFHACLSGPNQTFPFEPARDRIGLQPTPRFPAVQALADSGFAGAEWHLRNPARHARSKTVSR